MANHDKNNVEYRQSQPHLEPGRDSIRRIYHLVSHGFTIGQAIAMNGTYTDGGDTVPTYVLAINDGTQKQNCIGIVSQVYSPDDFELVNSGHFFNSIASSYSVGRRYFLSDSSAGSITTAAGPIVIGDCQSNSEITININISGGAGGGMPAGRGGFRPGAGGRTAGCVA